jgi:hypothetical protein
MLSLSWSRWPLLSYFSADAELCELSNICTKQLKLMLALVKCSQHGEHLIELQLLWQPHDHNSILFTNPTLTGHHCQMWDVRLMIWDFQKVHVTSCLVIWEDGAWREVPRRSPCHRVLLIVPHKSISPVSWFQTSHALGWNEAPIALLMEVSTGRSSSNNKQRSSNCFLKLHSPFDLISLLL